MFVRTISIHHGVFWSIRHSRYHLCRHSKECLLLFLSANRSGSRCGLIFFFLGQVYTGLGSGFYLFGVGFILGRDRTGCVKKLELAAFLIHNDTHIAIYSIVSLLVIITTVLELECLFDCECFSSFTDLGISCCDCVVASVISDSLVPEQ